MRGRKEPRSPRPQTPDMVVKLVNCSMTCAACGREIRTEELTKRRSRVRMELLAVLEDADAVRAGCKHVLVFEGERFGVMSAMHEACMG